MIRCQHQDAGNLFDAFYGGAALVRLRPYLDRVDLHALAPGEAAPVAEADLFDWTRDWTTRDAFRAAFGRELGDELLRVAVSRGWRFVSWRQATDAGDVYEAGPIAFDSGPLDEARREQRAYLRTTWVNGTLLGKLLNLDQPDGPPHPEVLADERIRQRKALRKTWIAGTPLGSFLNLDEPDPAPSAKPAQAARGWENYDAGGAGSAGGDAGSFADAPIGIAPESAMAQLLVQIDRRFPFRGKGALDGLEGDVLRITDDPGRNGPRRTGPDLGALRRAVGADRRTRSTEFITGPQRVRYLAIWPHPSLREDASMWELGELDPKGGDTGEPADATDAGSVNAFGIDLFHRARRQSGNLVLSPFSVFGALAMTLGGAKGRTAAQMKTVLHLDGPTERAVERAGRLLGSYQTDRQGVTLRIANRLFGDKAYAFDPAFVERTADAFGAPLEPLDFRGAPDQARRRINGWVEKQTEDRIKDLIPDGGLDAATRLVLANAIYFLGDWERPFEPGATRPEPFLSGSAGDGVPTMHQTAHFRFAAMDGVKVLELPYRSGDLAMVLALPDAVDGLGACEARLAPSTIADWLGALAPTRVAVALPKFKLEPPSLSLGDTLSALGMPLAFDADKADFTGIANPPDPRDRLAVSNVFHKAFIKVDEKGTEAAAATAVMVRALSMASRPEAEFTADHPFLFFIVDTRTGLILFMGRVSDPGAGFAGTGGFDAGGPDDWPPYSRPLKLLHEATNRGATSPSDAHARASALLAQLAGDAETSGPSDVDEENIFDRRGEARLYRPSGAAPGASPALVLAHGLSPQGIKDPRLVRFARALANVGIEVLTPELRALIDRRVDPRCLDTIGAAVRTLADRTGGPVGLVGLSLAGGLALLAAGDPEFAQSIAYVVCVGAHHDLGRVCRRLQASQDGARLAKGLEDVAPEALAAVSPRGQLDRVRAPVFLLHGAEDTLVPATESERIASELPASTLRACLVTPALSHVDVDGSAVTGEEAGALVNVLASILAEANGSRGEAGDLGGVVNAGLGVGEGALAKTGSAGTAAAEGAKLGSGIGGAVGTVAGTVAVAAGIMGATTAAFSVVPVIGTAIGAVVGAVAGLAYYLGKDTYHPTALEAQELLELWRADPALIFAGFDTLTTKSGNRQMPAEELAARLVRYHKLVAGEVPNHGPLYNPVSNHSCENPYMCRVDPSDRLTDPKYLRRVKALVERHRLAPPEVTTPEHAAAVLRVLRAGLAQSKLLAWSELPPNLAGLRNEVKILRGLAGEHGPDRVLGGLLRGDVSPVVRARPHRRPLARPAPVVAAASPASSRVLDPFRGLQGTPVPRTTDAGAPREDVPAAIYMRSIVEVVDSGDALFAWRSITVTYKRHSKDPGLLATFWVFADALRDRQSGLRWPCSAAESQLVADRILVAPQDLPRWWGPPSAKRSPCLMMTARLMAARWLHARQSHEIIPPHPQNIEDLLIADVTRMSAAIDRDLARLTPRDPWAADPGKIWALDRRLFDGSATAINYGQHVDPVLTPVPFPLSTNGAIPGLSLIQSIGDRHGPDHIDYSQILLLVAPWCMVARIGHDQMEPMATADVYQSAELAGLVTDDAKPLVGVRQPFDPNQLEPARAWFWGKQAGVWRQKQRLGLGVFDPLPAGALAEGRA